MTPNQDPYSPPPGIKPWVFRLLLLKRFFEQGDALALYVKYIAIMFGIRATSGLRAAIIVTVYGAFALCLGAFWHWRGLVTAEYEMANRFNAFLMERLSKK